MTRLGRAIVRGYMRHVRGERFSPRLREAQIEVFTNQWMEEKFLRKKLKLTTKKILAVRTL